MRKIVTVLLSLLIAFGLVSCNDSKSSSNKKSVVESSSSIIESSSSKVEVPTYLVKLNTGTLISFEQVTKLDLSSLVEGDVVKFKLTVVPGTKGEVVVKINDTVVEKDSSSVYTYVVEKSNLDIECSGVALLSEDLLTFTGTDAASFVSVDENELPSSLTEGDSVSFKLKLNENTTGTPVVKVSDVVLTADEAGVYTYVLEDEDAVFTLSGVRLLENYTLSLKDSSRYSLTDENGATLDTDYLEGESLQFKVIVFIEFSPLEKVLIGDEEITPDEDGVYTYTPTGDFVVEAYGVKKEVTLKSTSEVNMSFNFSEDYLVLLKGDTVSFSVSTPSFATTTDVVVKAGDTELSADADGNYTVVVEDDLSITVTGNSVADDSAVVLVGDGSEESPYLLSSPLELIKFSSVYASTHVDASTYTEYTYVTLTEDIDMEGYAFTPINGFYGFFGDFNGNGKTISNFNVDSSVSTRAALFFLSNSSVIYNLNINTMIDVSDYSLDAVAAVSAVSFATDFYGVSVTGSVLGDAYAMGGIVGIDISNSKDSTDAYSTIIYEGNSVDLDLYNYNDGGSVAGLIGIADNAAFGGTDAANLLVKNNKISGLIYGGYFVSGISTSIGEASTVTGNYIDASLYTFGTGDHAVSAIIGGDGEASSSVNRYILNNCFAGNIYYDSVEDLYAGISSFYATALTADTYFIDSLSIASVAESYDHSASLEEINNNNIMGLDLNVWVFSEGSITLKSYDDYFASLEVVSYSSDFTLTEDSAVLGLGVEISPLSFINLLLPSPEKDGLVFAGWYLYKELTVPYEANMVFIKDTVLYAKWSLVPDLKDYVGEYKLDLSDDSVAYISIKEDGTLVYFVEGNTVVILTNELTEVGLKFSDGFMTLNLEVLDDDTLAYTVDETSTALVLLASDEVFPTVDAASFIDAYVGEYTYNDAYYGADFELIVTGSTDSTEGNVFIAFNNVNVPSSSITLVDGEFTATVNGTIYYFVKSSNGIEVKSDDGPYGVTTRDYMLKEDIVAPTLSDYYGIYTLADDTPFGDSYIEIGDVMRVDGVADYTVTFSGREDGSVVLTFMDVEYKVGKNYFGYVNFGEYIVSEAKISTVDDYVQVYEVTDNESKEVSYITIDEAGNVLWGEDSILGTVNYFGTFTFTMNATDYTLEKSGYWGDYDLLEVSETPSKTYSTEEFNFREAEDYAGFYRDGEKNQVVLTEDELHSLNYESYDVVAKPGKLIANTLNGETLTFVMNSDGLEMTGVMADGTTEIPAVTLYETTKYSASNFSGIYNVSGRTLVGMKNADEVLVFYLDNVLGSVTVVDNVVTFTFGEDTIVVSNTGEEGVSVTTLNSLVTTMDKASSNASSYTGNYSNADYSMFFVAEDYSSIIKVGELNYYLAEFSDNSYLYFKNADGSISLDYTVEKSGSTVTLVSTLDSNDTFVFVKYTDSTEYMGTYYADVNGDGVTEEFVINAYGKYNVLDLEGEIVITSGWYSDTVNLKLNHINYTLSKKSSLGSLKLAKYGEDTIMLNTFSSLVVGKSYVATIDEKEYRFDFTYESDFDVIAVTTDNAMLLLINESELTGSAEFNGVKYTFSINAEGVLTVVRSTTSVTEANIFVTYDENVAMQELLLADEE